MLPDQILLVDIGNTYIKFCPLANIEGDIQVTDSIKTLIAHIQTGQFKKIWLASVSRQDLTEQIITTCASLNIKFQEAQSEANAFGIKNSYQDAQKMGVDRWLAMVGATKLTKKPFAVIDAGTAITCDFVADGQHLGGWIAPGFDTMKAALVKNTTKVFADHSKPTHLEAGQSTESCVAMGCLAALNGVVLAANRFLSERFDDFCIIQCGGDKKMLACFEQGVNLCAANGVLLGLARYAENDLGVC